MRRARKYALRFLLVVLSAAFLAFVAAQTTWVRSWIKGTVESAVSNATNGILTIELLGGTLFGDVTIEGVTLRLDGDTLASIARLEVDFSVWGLLSSEALVHDLRIDSLNVRIMKNIQGEWNVNRLAKASQVTDSAGVASEPFPWVIRAERIRLSGGSLTVNSHDSGGTGPLIVRDLGMDGNLTVAAEGIVFSIDSLRFVMGNPDVELRRLTAKGEISGGALRVAQAEILTAANAVRFSGQLGLQEGVRSSVELSTDALDLSEVPGLPAELGRGVHPRVHGRAELADDELAVDLTLSRLMERLRVFGTIARLSTEFRPSVTAELEHFNLGDWLPTILPTTDLNGMLAVRLAGLDPERLDADVSATLIRSSISDQALDSVKAQIHLQGHAMSGTVALSGGGGQVRIDAGIRDLWSLTGYDIALDAEDLDLSIPLKDERVGSRLSVKARLQGDGTDPKSAAARLAISVRGEFLRDVEIDSLTALAELVDGRILLREFAFRSPAVAIRGSGEFGPDEALSATATLEVIDAARISTALGLDSSLAGTGTLEVTADGLLDSLIGQVDFTLAGARYEPAFVDSLRGRALVSITHGEVEVSGPLEASGLVVSGVKVREVDATVRYRGGTIEAAGSLGLAEELGVRFGGTVRLGEGVNITLPSLAVVIGEDTWVNAPDTVRVTVSGPTVELRGFAMHSGDQSIGVEGIYDSEDSLDIALGIDRAQMGPMFEHSGLDVPASGELTATIAIQGTALSPFITAKVNLREILVAGLPAGTAALDASAHDRGIRWDLTLVDAVGNTVLSNGRLPYQIGSGGISVAQDSSVAVRLETNGYDLRWIRSLRDEFENASGILTARLDLSGSLAAPVLDGMVGLESGELTVPSVGLEVKELALSGKISNSVFALDTLRALVGGGQLMGSGTARLPFGSQLPSADSMVLVLSGRGLSAKSPRAYEVKVDTDLRASFTGEGLDYSGTITVPESRIFLAGIFTTMTTRRRSVDRPLLVQLTMPLDSLAASSAEEKKAASRNMPVIGKQTRGRVALSFPKNTWIQSPNVNVELYGDLTAIQTDTLLEIEGTLKISRGTVQLLGKRFLVRNGTAEFSRGPRINPAFTIELEYRFRDANRQDRSLIARLTGNVENPNMVFALDEKPVTQQDAISYLIFGRSVEELTINQQSSMSGEGGSGTGSVAFDMVGAQLSNIIAQRVGLDVVEIKSTDGAKAGTLTAGKYIAEGVFVSYEKGFGEYGVNETMPEVFTIEYELIRSLFLQFVQANDRRSGADIIYKIQ